MQRRLRVITLQGAIKKSPMNNKIDTIPYCIENDCVSLLNAN